MTEVEAAAAPSIRNVTREAPRRLHHDHETYSDVDLRKTGASVYARHPSTEILMTAYAVNDGPIKQWIPAEGQAMPAELEDPLLDERVLKFAWNKSFEQKIWKHCEGIDIPHDQWRDPMVLALTLSLPGKLERACPIVNLPLEYQKDLNGANLIGWFCKPRPATKTKPERRVRWWEQPGKWEDFLFYNRQDVVAERAFWVRTRAYDLPEHEWALWVLDQEINERGVPVNTRMVENAVKVKDELIEKRLAELAEITGLENPNSNQQILPWLQEQGYRFLDLKKGHIQTALKDVEAAENDEPFCAEESFYLQRALELRSEVSRSSIKKFDALQAHTDEDGRIRDIHQFAGAGRTWRWAGRVFQGQNLAKPEEYLSGLEWGETTGGSKQVIGGAQINAARHLERFDADTLELLYSKPIDVVSSCVRPVVQAPDGHLLIDGDWKAIENILLGWMSGDQKILRVFDKGLDPYIDFATYLYGETYDTLFAEYKAGDKRKRTVAKPGVLGCGYMLSAGQQYENKQTGEVEGTGLLGYAWNMGVSLTPEESAKSVEIWRATFTEAVEFWGKVDRAMRRCIKTGKPQECWPVRFDIKKQFLRMILPSGRALHYCRPRLEQWRMPWGKYKLSITYEGLDERGVWGRISTHPGKITENADQAIARDILAHGMMNANREGIPIIMHVHDQIVGCVKEDDAEDKLRLLKECMEDRPDWAADLPLAVEGHITKWFVKD